MKTRLICWFVGLGLVLGLGCGKSDPTTNSGPPMMGPGGMMGPPSGNDVFDKNCANCHSVAAVAAPGGPKQKGPNLSKAGGERTAAWLSDHIKDPKSHKPMSKMPEFGTKLSADELKSVSDFLAGLK